MCCTRLAANTGRKNDAKNRHLGTIPQLCRAISSQLRRVSTIGKKLVKQQYLLHMSPQYGELRLTSGWDRFGSLRHPSYFQRLPRLGSVTARQSSSKRQPNFAALNRGRHLCLAGRPSRWALAHILVGTVLFRVKDYTAVTNGVCMAIQCVDNMPTSGLLTNVMWLLIV